MSVLDNLFSSLTGGDGPGKEHPCRNCPGDCPIAGEACEICRPYKEKLLDALYNVEHAEELRARYVVSPSGAPAGTVTCPYCGAPSANRVICEFCGMELGEGDGKIYVASAAEIPNPILDARDIIYDRYAAVGGRYTAASSYLSQIGVQKTGGFLSGLLDLLNGGDSEGLGTKMTEAEILEAAGLYGMTVAQYLSGLDNGSCLPLSEKKQEDQRRVYAAGTAAIPGAGYAARRPNRQERPAPPPPRRPGGNLRSPRNRQRREDRYDAPPPPGAFRPRQGEQPFQPGKDRRPGAQPAPPAPPARRNERGISRQTPPAPPARRNDRSAGPGPRLKNPPPSPGPSGRGGGPGRRPEGPPRRPGGNDRGGGHQR